MIQIANIFQIAHIFTHLKLCLTTVTYNLKLEEIAQFESKQKRLQKNSCTFYYQIILFDKHIKRLKTSMDVISSSGVI